MRLREGLRVVRRSDTEVQVGTDPRWAVRITDLAHDEVAALLTADAVPGPSGSDGSTVGRGALPTHTPRLRAIADQLVAAQLAHAATDGRPNARSDARSDRGLDGRVARGTGTSDAQAWDLVDGTGRDRVAARAQRVVGVLGLGPTGTTVALALAASGVGTVLVDDARPVRSTDVGGCGYRWSDVGRQRDTVVARMVRDAAPRVAIESTRVPDLLVVVEHGATDPVRAADVLATGVPHLSVVVREADVVVGPLVVDGDGPCLRCLDLHRADADAAWPVVAEELSRPARDGDEVGVLAAVAGGLAAAAALGFLDRREPLAASYEVGLPDAVPRRRDWAVHPSCGCTAQSI
ncbi:ThiF family adenylyltransferase [Cellulomonas rhizosphaerae]|uniref:ThiF family adenylyltransferase n=1 Tax=Cellulomonas rhizosphaerae TaxID=2293719 RepID=A0A413RQD5_9CELL|nr:ThiF family adenylyltransferase [Cellulomonas rhizosphaerae]RHA44167.1 ThiF family adenylyltransferase [Cellulomonas rhizosphaerae]